VLVAVGRRYSFATNRNRKLVGLYIDPVTEIQADFMLSASLADSVAHAL